MTDFWTIENAFFTMVLLVMLGCVTALIIAPNVDMIISSMRGQGFDAGAGTDWDTTSEFWFVHNLFVLFLWCPGPLGIAIFLIACAKRQRRDDYAEAGAIYYGEE